MEWGIRATTRRPWLFMEGRRDDVLAFEDVQGCC
jgi:hypothetical protein